MGISPKLVVINDIDGNAREYILHKVPARKAREIFTQYLPSAAPKIGDYKLNEQLMQQLIGFVGVPTDSGVIMLSTPALIDNHVPDWETLGRLELAMAEYNCSFFAHGKLQKSLQNLEAKLPQLILGMLTRLSEQLSAQNKQRSGN